VSVALGLGRFVPLVAGGLGGAVFGGLGSMLAATARAGATITGGVGANIGGALSTFPLTLGSILSVIVDRFISFFMYVLQIGLGVVERMWYYMGEDPVKFLMLAVNLAVLMS